MRRYALALLFTLAAAMRSLGAQSTPDDMASLHRVTQHLMDAITTGDSVVWARQLLPQWFVTDEEGHQQTRAEFLAELHGLPPGQHGRLEAKHFREAREGNVVVLSYDIDERHDYYGQELRTRFHSTDSWVRTAGGWRLLGSQITALPTPIAGRRVARRLLDEYAGTYALTPDISLRLVADDSGLAVVRGARPPERLRALDDRTFVRNGVRGFWLFTRDSVGVVVRAVSWRDNQPVVWRRVGR